jgi:hypothetical protein
VLSVAPQPPRVERRLRWTGGSGRRRRQRR